MTVARRLGRVPPVAWLIALVLTLAWIVAQWTGAIYGLVPPRSGAGWEINAIYAYPTPVDPAKSYLAYDASGNAHIVRGGATLIYRWFSAGQWHEVPAPGCGPIAVAADGTVWLVYAADGDIQSSRFEDGAWSAPLTVARTAGDSLNPVLALDAKGRPQVAWEDYTFGRREILFSSYAGGAWSRPFNLSASPDRESARPTIAVGEDARVHVAWQEEDARDAGCYDIYYAVYDGTWSKPEPVITWDGDQEEPSLTIDAAGRPVIAFSDYAAGGIYVTQREGSAWLEPRQIDFYRSEGQSPSVVAGPDGTLHFAWAKLVRASALSFSRVKLQVFYRTLVGNRLSAPISLGSHEGFRGEVPCQVAPALALTPSGQPGVVFDDLVGGKWSTCYASSLRPQAAPATALPGSWLMMAAAVLFAVGLACSLRARPARKTDRSQRAWYRSPVALAVAITLTVGAVWGAGAGLVNRLAAMPVGARPAGWSAPVPISRGPGDASSPRLAIDAQDQVHVIWTGTVGTIRRIYYRDLTSDAIRTIDNDSVGGSDRPALAFANGKLYAAWQAWTPTPEVMLAEFSSGTWTPGKTIFSDKDLAATPTLQAAGNPLTAGCERPALAAAPGSEQPVYLGWTFGSRARGDIIVSALRDGTWGAPVNISLDTGASDQVALAVGPDGKLHAVWADTTLDRAVGQNRADIFYRTFDGRAWSDTRNISLNGSQSTAPLVVPDATGRVSFLWVDSGVGTGIRSALERLLGDRPQLKPPTVVYRRMERGRLVRGRSIDVPVPRDYPRMPGAVSVAAAVDRQGRLNVVWSRFTGSDYRLYYRQLDGLRWSRAYLLAVSDKVSEPFEFQPAQPDIAVDSAGALHVVWPMYHNGRFDVYYLKRDAVSKR